MKMKQFSNGNWRLWFFPLDTLFLMLLVLPTFKYDFTSALAVSAVGLYLLVDLLVPVERAWFINATKAFLIIWVIGVVAIMPTLFNVISRDHGQPDANLHDGAFQTEVALRFLIAGKNPYAMTYFGTGLEQYEISDVPENPALYNFVYFPAILLIALPFYLFTSITLAWFDQRLVFLFFFLMTLVAVPQLTDEPLKKRLLLILVGLNIYTVEFLQTGRNDILIFSLLILAVAFLKMEKLNIAGVFLALACWAKPSAWFFVPFLSIYLARGLSWRANAYVWLRKMNLFFVTSVLLILPFLVWDADAFWRSTVAYTFGFSDTPLFPAQGYGFSTILLVLGIVPSRLAPFPFIIFQVMACVPALGLTLRAQSRENTINRVLLNGALLFLAFMFFSRFFHDNYLQFAVMMINVAAVMDPFVSDWVTQKSWSLST
jgi:hypothetical protein